MSTTRHHASSENVETGKEIAVAISINTDTPGAISALDYTINFDTSQLEPTFYTSFALY